MLISPQRSRIARRALWLSGLCAAGFVVLSVAVHTRTLAPFDTALMLAVQAMRDCRLAGLSTAASSLFAVEVCLLLSLVLSLFLWRAGFGVRSLIPWALYGTLGAELALKLWMKQPLPNTVVSTQWLHDCGLLAYPFTTLATENSYPSGFALRMAFFLTLPPLLFADRWRTAVWLWGAAALGGAVILMWSRLLLEWHWPTDLVGGVLLGTAASGVIARLVLAPGIASTTLRGTSWERAR